MVVAGACSTVSDGPAPAADTAAERFEASLGCDGLADRWAALQQEYLDRLGAATAVDLAEQSPAVASAGRWLGNAMIEQTRDADAVGCTDLVAGSDALCARIGRLSAAGEAAEIVLSNLRAGCG